MNDRAFSLSNSRAAARRWVGAACVALFLGALAVLAIWSGGWLQHRVEYVARFETTSALSKSSLVLLLGQPVGRVHDLRVAARDGRPVVEVGFWVEGAQLEWMREGVTVTERAPIVGSPWLELAPGAAGAPALAAGSTVPTTVNEGLLDRVLKIQPVVEGLIAEIDTLVGTLNETVKRVDPILAQVESQLATTREALDETTKLITSSHEMFEQLKVDQAALVGGMVATLEQVNEELLPALEQTLVESRTMMAGTATGLDEAFGVIQTRLPELLATMQETLANTRDITEATKHTWPFSRYWKKKEKADAATARR